MRTLKTLARRVPNRTHIPKRNKLGKAGSGTPKRESNSGKTNTPPPITGPRTTAGGTPIPPISRETTGLAGRTAGSGAAKPRINTATPAERARMSKPETRRKDYSKTSKTTELVELPVGKWASRWKIVKPYVIGGAGMYALDRMFFYPDGTPVETTDDMYILDPYMLQMMGGYPVYQMYPNQPSQPVNPMLVIDLDSLILPTDLSNQSSTYSTDAIGTLLTDLLRYSGDRETLRNSGIMGYYRPIMEDQLNGIYRSLRDMPTSALNWYLDLIGYLASKGVQNKEQLIKALKDNQQYSTLLQQYGVS